MTEFAVMVERHLRLRKIDGQTDVIVQIAAPVLDGNAYDCKYLIKGIGKRYSKERFWYRWSSSTSARPRPYWKRTTSV